ncbi:serine/threonine protein kinase [Chondromyces apiculatus]|uniref:Serine/threonine protein kinase n=1 Tax=Chondromyces apiculatus DSM 436 TaxID=1192034 RepID=A0A017T5S2_9BACT|nr:serine/threonine protein kinase [Chondromyces apiculatus]EYF03936.1 serine/threonine protein kinase [Chondromyces apiculatus DSM 436]
MSAPENEPPAARKPPSAPDPAEKAAPSPSPSPVRVAPRPEPPPPLRQVPRPLPGKAPSAPRPPSASDPGARRGMGTDPNVPRSPLASDSGSTPARRVASTDPNVPRSPLASDAGNAGNASNAPARRPMGSDPGNAAARRSLGSDPSAPRSPLGSDPGNAAARRSLGSDPGGPRSSDPDVGYAGKRGDAVTIMGSAPDPEPSIEIPPPAELIDERQPGATDPYIGTTFDHRYKIERLLGEGGMGFVYLARHKVIDKKVAVKVLRAELARDEEIFERFVQEARAASSVGNPHIVDVSDFGDLPDGSKYFVMEYLEGSSLSQIIDGPGEITVDFIYKVSLQMADGLAAAHSGGIVHRDLKPDNVYVVRRGKDAEFVKILDFGIAKVTTDAESRLTRAGAVFGTPHYMSPEQAAGAPIDLRTDIYSMGVMLYELGSRQLPFTADNFMGILTQHMYKAPVPLRALLSGPGPTCPPALEAIILKCLSKKPESRYQTMAELREDMETARSGGVPKAVPEMMSRSGGFNVPQDYFKLKPAPAAGASTSVEGGRRVPRWALFAGGAAVLGVGVAIALAVGGGSAAGNAEIPGTALPPRPTGAGVTAPAPSATGETSSVAPGGPEIAPAVPAKRVSVTLKATPEGAKGYVDGKPLQLPATFEVQEGKPLTVEIRADGFVSQVVQLDGSEAKRTVKLAKEAAKSPGTKGTSQSLDPSLRDPWATKKR